MIKGVISLSQAPEATSLEGLFTHGIQDGATVKVPTSLLKGNKGDEGLNAYQVWLSLGNEGTEQDFIDDLANGITLEEYSSTEYNDI